MKKTLVAFIAVLASFNASAVDYKQFVEGDNILGSITAPVTFIEYASMTCGHCASFDTNVVKKLKTEYVDTGKVAYTFRDLPFDKLAYAVSKVQRCVQGPEFYTLNSAFFQTQKQWLGAADKLGAINGIARLGGLTEAQVEACILDENIQTLIERYRQSAANLGIQSTPSFIVNGTIYTGAKSYEQVKQIIDAELAK